MPVVIGGWDSVESFMDAVARGETPNPLIPPPPGVVQTGENEYVIEPAGTTPTPWVSPAITNLTRGIGNAVAGVMTNPVVASSVLAGAWTGFNPGDLAGGLAILKSYSLSVYGSSDLGVIRRSSEVLENEPSGIRPGTMERIVIPTWARRERGSPI